MARRHPFALRGWRDGFSVPSVFSGMPRHSRARPLTGRRPGAAIGS
ncbi:protein of unassigned function [Methylobacterium oryzae CBMB20]|uniref:Protein of unassigned function n=1 Tax=Methylobacterium oryzae CBMB20 TaxID=693986 RepID=A0A089NYQ0_9HYPH|nr:protein of unassigned function [Methylobacterium oryzae CBMB20]